MPEKSSRDASIERMAEVMREFMARAVLFQDAVARFGGINSTDMQAVSLLMSEGPATPGELAERTGPHRGRRHHGGRRPPRTGRLRHA